MELEVIGALSEMELKKMVLRARWSSEDWSSKKKKVQADSTQSKAELGVTGALGKMGLRVNGTLSRWGLELMLLSFR